MAIASFSTFDAELDHPKESVAFGIATTTTIAGRWQDLWTSMTIPGTAPTTAAAPTSATAGALGQQDSTVATLGLVSARISTLTPGCYLLIDRLSHQGGMNATSTGTQTTNLPTSALTRYTTGEGVMLGVTIYTQIGTTATTISCSYTNSAGTAARTSPSVVFGGTGFREAGRFIPIPLASGDTGVRSVQNSTIAGSTGTVGAFGYCLYKPLAMVMVDEVNSSVYCDLVTGKIGGGLPEVVDGACLGVLAMPTTTTVQATGVLQLAEW